MDMLGELNLTPLQRYLLMTIRRTRPVKKALPEIMVPDWPDQSVLYTKTLIEPSLF